MNIVIDLELEEVIADFSKRVPTDPIEVKSQDTPIMAVYFVQRGATFDLGPTPGIRFGLFLPGNPNPLVLCSTFTRVLDQTNRTCYRGYPNFNTVPLTAALGTKSTIACLGEWRYQTSGGTITRTQDVSFTIQRVLLSETILDNTTAAFTTPAVGSNVTIAITTTGWLNPGQILNIGAGAGNYTVVSITDGTHFVAQNNGGTGNAAPGIVIPSGTSVGIAPVTVLSTYPDPSTIELLPHKGAVNGYAELDANRLLLGSRVPVDGQTITVNASGKIASAMVLATVAANFTTPASGGTVSVTLSNTTSLVPNQYVRIPIAGYYIVNSITDATHAVLQNNGDPFNASAGATITPGAVLLPAQAAAGGGGTAGQNAFTNTLAGFTVPASGATVSVNLGSTAWLGGSGYVVFIAGAGYYAVSSITDATHAVLTNLGYAATNAAPGISIPTGAAVSPGGLQGPASTAIGANAYDLTQASFTMPVAAASVNIVITNTAWITPGQVVYVAGAGYFTVAGITSPTVFNATNANYPGNAAPGATIATGARVSTAGLIGPQGAGGPGLNAFTTLTSNFTQPAVGSTVTAVVGTTAWMVATEVIYIAGGGYYQISSIGDLTHVTVTNLGYPGNAAPAATITGSGTQGVSPGGLIGPNGISSYTTTTANFTMPAAGATVTIALQTTAFIQQNQNIFVAGAGYFAIASITDSTHVAATNLGASGNIGSGTVIAAGAGVTTAGAIGPAGGIGPTGPSGGIGEAPTDGQQYARQSSAWAVVTGGGGGGGAFDPRAGVWHYDEFNWASATHPLYQFSPSGSGTISVATTYGKDSTHKISGVLELSTATASGAGGYCFCLGAIGFVPNGYTLGAGIFDLAVRLAIETSLPPTGVGFKTRIGLLTQNAAISTFPDAVQTGQSSIILEYSPDANSGNFRIGYGFSGAALTYTNCTAGPAADTCQWWEFKITAAGVCTAYLNGTSISSVTIPSNVMGVNLCPIVLVNRTSGTGNYNVAVDTLFVNYPYTRNP